MRSHIIWAISARKGSTYLPLHSLFELPVLPLQNMHDLAPLFCHFSISAPIQNRLAVNMKFKRLHATSKCPPWPLTGCCSLSDGKNENNAKGGDGEGSPVGGTLRGYTSLTERDSEMGGTAEGTGGGGEVTRVITHPAAGTDGGRGGTHNVQCRGWLCQAHSRGGRTPKGILNSVLPYYLSWVRPNSVLSVYILKVRLASVFTPISLSGTPWMCTVFQLRGSIYPSLIASHFVVHMESYASSVKPLSSLVNGVSGYPSCYFCRWMTLPIFDRQWLCFLALPVLPSTCFSWHLDY